MELEDEEERDDLEEEEEVYDGNSWMGTSLIGPKSVSRLKNWNRVNSECHNIKLWTS